jgi:RNA polymerase sigma-70 factor, ECF subfamily
VKVEKEFLELIQKHQGILHKICNIYFYKNPYKEDFYQEILIRLWKSYPGFQNRSAFSTWLYRVALNTAIDLIRKLSLQPKYIELTKAEFNIPDHDPGNQQDRSDTLYQAIHYLSDVEKAIIFLYLEDYNYKEIAEVIGISETNAGVKINRIKNQLLKILQNG